MLIFNDIGMHSDDGEVKMKKVYIFCLTILVTFPLAVFAQADSGAIVQSSISVAVSQSQSNSAGEMSTSSFSKEISTRTAGKNVSMHNALSVAGKNGLITSREESKKNGQGNTQLTSAKPLPSLSENSMDEIRKRLKRNSQSIFNFIYKGFQLFRAPWP